MAITVTTIQPQDSISGSRLVLNSNFNTVANEINTLENFINPSTAVISGVKSLTVDNSTVSITSPIFTVTKGSSLLGSVVIGTSGAATSVTVNGTGGMNIIQSPLTISGGDFNLSSPSNSANISGNLSVSGELRLPGSAQAFSSIIGLTASKTLTIAGLQYIVLTNASSGGLTASLPAGSSAGQVLEIYHKLGTAGNGVTLNTSNFNGLTGGIQLTQTGDTLKCVYDGSTWYMWNYNPSSLATASHMTLNIITAMNGSSSGGTYDDGEGGTPSYDATYTDGSYGPYSLYNRTKGDLLTSINISVVVVDAAISSITLSGNTSYFSNQWSITDQFYSSDFDAAAIDTSTVPGYGPVTNAFTAFTISATGASTAPFLAPAGSSIIFKTS